MGKMLEPQMLPPQPIPSCQTQEQTNYKVEDQSLHTRHSKECTTDVPVEDQMLLDSVGTCVSPRRNDELLDADESASAASSSSIDSAHAEKVSPVLKRSNPTNSDEPRLEDDDVDHGDDNEDEDDDDDNGDGDCGDGSEDVEGVYALGETSFADSQPSTSSQGLIRRGEQDTANSCTQSRPCTTAPMSTENASNLTLADAVAKVNTHSKPTDKIASKSQMMKLGSGLGRTGKSPGSANGTKACAKKSFVWKYFRHPEMTGGITDRSRTQCILCDSQLAFNASGTTTTMLNHLKSRHGDVAEQEESARRHFRSSKSGSATGIDLLGSGDPSSTRTDHPGRGSFGRSLSGTAAAAAGRVARNPLTVGQRGRPPGPNRRTKYTKMTNSGDYLHTQPGLQSGQLKSDGTPLFPLGCYSGLTEEQQRVLLNEFFSTEALSGPKDPNLFMPGLSGHSPNGTASAAHPELRTLMTAAAAAGNGNPSVIGMSGVGLGRVENADNQNASVTGTGNTNAKSCLSSTIGSVVNTTINTTTTTTVTTTNPTAVLNRNSLLNAAAASVAAAFANGSFASLPPLAAAAAAAAAGSMVCSSTITGTTTTMVPHDASPSSSSGMGVSVTSPMETPTTTGSPNQIGESARCVTSPTAQSPWLLSTHSKSAGRDITTAPAPQTSMIHCGIAEAHGEHSPLTNGGEDHSSHHRMNNKPNPNGLLTNSLDSSHMDLQSKLLALGLPFTNPSGNLAAPGVVPGPNDLATFGNFMNFMPPFNAPSGTGAYPTIDQLNLQHHHQQQHQQLLQQQQQQQQQHHHQQQNQTWLAAHAWLTSLANGKFLAPSGTTFGSDQSSQMVNLFTNGPGVPNCPMGKSFVGDIDRLGQGFPSPFLLSSCMDHPESNGAKVAHLSGWPQGNSSAVTSPSPTSLSIAPLPTTTDHLGNTNQTNNKARKNYSSERCPIGTFQNLVNFAKMTTNLNNEGTQSQSAESLDLSQNAHRTTSVANNNDRIILVSGEETQFQTTALNATTTTASTKRKRARPIYISPEFEPKRRMIEASSVNGPGDDLVGDDEAGPMNLSSPSRSVSPTHENTENTHDSKSVKLSPSMSGCSKHRLKTSDLLQHLTYYLVNDLQPPEVIEGQGFRNLLKVMGDYDVPSAREIRDHVLPKLLSSVQTKASRDWNEFTRIADTDTAQSESSRPHVATACAVELWTCSSHGSAQSGKAHHANLEIHCASSRAKKKFHGRVLRTIKVTDAQCLKENLKDCVQMVDPSCDNRPKCISIPHGWPLPLVTNQPFVLTDLIQSNSSVPKEQDENTASEFLVIPCLLSALSRAVATGLNKPEVQRLLQAVQRSRTRSPSPLSPGKPKTATLLSAKEETASSSTNVKVEETRGDSLSTANPCTTWSACFELLKTKVAEDQTDQNDSDLIAAKKLLAVFETMTQALELIHRKDLVLTASMIEPILQNLIEVRLAPETGQGTTNPDSVEKFKTAVAEYLSQSYPNSGDLRVTLQLASLLDPRFKDHVQEQNPATIKLLKVKADAIQLNRTSGEKAISEASESSLGTNSTMNSSINTSTKNKVKTTSESAGLETVFGLARPTLSEVDRYLREDPIDVEADPLTWWNSKSVNYPRLAQLALYYLTIPLTCYANGRLRPVQALQADGVSGTICQPFDGLGLPRIIDPLGRDRSRLSETDQSIYNVLWHNVDLIFPKMERDKDASE